MTRTHAPRIALNRRHFLAATGAALAAPSVARAQGFRDLAADHADRLHSIVVRRDDEEIFAQSWGGRGLDGIANVKSVSKTLMALLTGIAIDRGVIEGTDARVLPLLGRPETGDARDDLTIDHLLTMRTGLESVSGGNYGAWVASGNWVDTALEQDLVGTPGGRFIYSTGGWHVLGALLSQVTGQNLLSLTRDWLGAPMGIDFAPWVQDPQGRYLGGNDMALSPRGLARIGQMAVDDGQWQDKTVVSEGWLDTSWEPRTRSPFSGDQYGYGWFLTRMDGADTAYARGYGGQMLAVIPSRRMVIAITSDPSQPARSEGYFGDLRQLAEAIAAEV